MKHAILGASSAPRWKACPGSVREISKLPLSLRESAGPAALEGSAAHAVGEMILRGKLPPPFVHPDGRISGTAKPGFFAVTQEMLDGVMVYVNEVHGHLARMPGSELFIETAVKPLAERNDMFGTADAIIIQLYGELIVIDLKYGMRPVEVEWNDQALFYALGALEKVGDDAAIESVTIVIVQPRAPHPDGPVRRWKTTVEVVRGEADSLRSAARATEEPNAPLIAGEKQCLYCPVAASMMGKPCAALAKRAIAEAVHDFANVPPAQMQIKWPDESDGAAIARGLKLAEMLKTFVDRMPLMALHAANRGVTIPGFKIVRGTKHRQWLSEIALLAELKAANISPERYQTEPKLKSPAQLERVVGKDWIAKHAFKPEGNPTLVPDTDKRVALPPGVVSDFAALIDHQD